jgi:hypothetical protein
VCPRRRRSVHFASFVERKLICVDKTGCVEFSTWNYPGDIWQVFGSGKIYKRKFERIKMQVRTGDITIKTL